MSWVLRRYLSSRLICPACVHQTSHPARLLSSQSASTPRVCIIGSGPAGFYTAQSLLKGDKSLHVDIYDRLPVPFGLVRYGVAPDHPDVKNVINQFTTLATAGRCNFIGGVSIGKDIQVKELLDAYSAVVLSYGAESDKMLNVPGEDLPGFYSARKFVGWYNGLPEHSTLDPMMDTDTAVVIGHGNVALDVARILLTPLDILKKTDITADAIEALKHSKVKKVHVVGRRGPLNISFTIKELREMIKLPDCRTSINPEHFAGLETIIPELPRPKKRITELLLKSAQSAPSSQEKARQDAASGEWHLDFFRSPSEVLSSSPLGENGRVAGVTFDVCELENVNGEEKLVKTGESETIPCGLVLRSIGYKSVQVDDFIPFDHQKGVVKNELGRVEGIQGLYCSGWVKRGPKGVILSSLNDSIETAKCMLDDINSGAMDTSKPNGQDRVLSLLAERGVTPITFSDWTKIDAEERARGELVGKPREKMTRIEEMMDHALAEKENDGQEER
ncbi:NADPH:adrenodoxin oxidoreductase, mitochondrial [Strongylocentrotus purpuratus]|uniref:NADPH:adrenodoxin oxidoreductase, mitochondrial n=1 Tax=Strongylocentrotus purpuratus TaxID=7668 RepID=A0A7M7RD01_STRPU|nr:NADPH:adrenodoxin oxidoreductase, mitochondrial [Strongylocentrotus purpuratus]|eukprot:XP_790150.2 PREDICTED: NADPH:adrenodoxin oxidoreductase, mitochondrial [Strongylocentrotus purpuratus]